MFFSYFVGKCIASNADHLNECLLKNRHLELEGLIEVLCGTLHDSTSVLLDITEKFETSLKAFYEKYPIQNLDLHNSAKWTITEKEDAAWKAISDKIDEGPTGTAALDELKTSLSAERRTHNQRISIIEFIASEKSVSLASYRLSMAIENVKSASANAKLAAADAVIRSSVLSYEVASVFAPLLAERKYVSWNGFSYINLIESQGGETTEELRQNMLPMVISALPTSIARNAINIFGSRKLGQVFIALVRGNDRNSMYNLVLISLLMKSKPTKWLEISKEMIGSMKRDSIYLRHSLSMALIQLKEELNNALEVEQLKEFVAQIRLRRDLNIKSPNKKQIERAIISLSDNNAFGTGGLGKPEGKQN